MCVFFPPGVKRTEDECGERKCGDEEVHRRMQCYLPSHSVGEKKERKKKSEEVEDEGRGIDRLRGFVDQVHRGLRDLRDWAK